MLIACFDDTGLDAARCAVAAPVIGIGEAAFHMASLVAGKFSVVTTLARSIPAIEHNLAKYGLASAAARRCAPPRSRCSIWKSRDRTPAIAFRRDRAGAGAKIAPRRSYWDAPA